MPFPSGSDTLPTAEERYLQLSAAQASVPASTPSKGIPELSKILDGFFPINERPKANLELYLLDVDGYYDICKYSYEAAVDGGKASSLISCHEYMLVCLWYLYLRLEKIGEGVGHETGHPSFFNELGHDLLPAPVWEYLNGLGPLVLPNGMLVIPSLPDPANGQFPGLMMDYAVNVGAEGILYSPQFFLLKMFLQNYNQNPRKDLAYNFGNIAMPVSVLTDVVKSWDFPNPARSRALDETVHEFDLGHGNQWCWNPAVLQAYRAFSSSCRGKYVFKDFHLINPLHGSRSQAAIFQKQKVDYTVHFVFRSPVEMTSEDTTLAILFRYRMIYDANYCPAIGVPADLGRLLSPRDFAAPFGIRTSSKSETLSQVKDFCSYFQVLGRT